MADYTITIANDLSVLGIEPPSLWGVMVWGVDLWGADGDLITGVDKVLDNTLVTTSTIGKIADLVLTDSFALSTSLPTITLVDAAGYYHIFRGNVTNADDRIFTNYSQVASASVSWTSATPQSTTWS